MDRHTSPGYSIVRWGRFHRRYTVSVNCFTWFILGVHTFIPVFLTIEPPRFPICVPTRELSNDLPGLNGKARPNPLIPAADTFDRSHCDPWTPLDVHQCSVPYHYYSPNLSVVSQFNVPHSHCEFSPFKNVSWTESAFFFGFLLGVVIIGQLCDRLGRQKAILLSVTLITVAGLWSALALGILSFGLSRLVDGFGVGGAGIAVFILMSETTDTHHRQVVSAAQSVAFAVGAVYTAVLASFIPAWRYLILASNAPCWMVFLSFWASGVFVESPRWLIATGSHSKALAVFQLIADMEGEPLPEWVTPVTVDAFASQLDASKKEGCVEAIPILEDELDEIQELIVSDDVSSVPIRVRKDRAVHILYKKPFRRWSYVLFAMWFSASLTYYGVMLDTRHLAEASSWEARYVLKDDQSPVDSRLLSQYPVHRGLGEEVPVPEPMNMKDAAPEPMDMEDAAPEKPLPADAAADAAPKMPLPADAAADAAPKRPLPADAEKPLPADAAPEKPRPGGTELFGRASAMHLLSAQFQKNHVLSSYFESVRALAFTLSLSFLLEIPCNILVVWLTGQSWAKRKGTAVGCLFVAAFFCFFAFCLRSRTFIPSRFVIALTNSLANFARLAAGGAYTSLYLISAELFPTTIRSAAVGLCSMWARISAMLSPQIVEILEGARPGGPLLVFAVVSFLAALAAVCTLPETFEGPIFDNVQQLQAHDAAFQQKPKESFWDSWFHGGHVARFFIRPHAEPLDTRSPFADLPAEEAPLEWQLREDSEEIASLDFHVPLSRVTEVELT